PLLIIMREILGIVKTRKELKKILNEKKVKINGLAIKEDKTSLALFDVISIENLKKNYKLTFSKMGKFSLAEIKENEISGKICKVIGKKMLKGKKIQINFNDGRNLISRESANIGDSAIINFKEKKIEKILPVKEKSIVMVIKGKHLGEVGEIINVNNDKLTIKEKDKEFETVKKEVIVINS
ncbi:hypothetical protein HYW74_01720, partial [Candidatus Pacearchaeota archaeon]|nr:hypothetical protein [Candidatus Pacearchaeota archaeon]